MSSGTLEERRELIGCYVSEIRADPDRKTVRIGFYPTLLSQRIAGARYARPRNPADSDRGLILASLRAVFWERFGQAA